MDDEKDFDSLSNLDDEIEDIKTDEESPVDNSSTPDDSLDLDDSLDEELPKTTSDNDNNSDPMAPYFVRGLSRIQAARVTRAKAVASIVAGILLLFLSIFAMASVLAKDSKMVVEATDPGGSLSLSEYYDFRDGGANKLYADGIRDMDNILGAVDLPDGIDSIPATTGEGGSFNTDNAVIYTFYIINDLAGVSKKEANVKFHLDIDLNLLNMGAGMRIAVYENGVETIYAQASTDGSPEPIYDANEDVVGYTTPFLSDSQILSQDLVIGDGEIVRFTIVMWLEGPDKDTTDAVNGGQFGFSIYFDKQD